MGEIAPIHWLVVLFILVGIFAIVPVVLYRHGKKVGDQTGYNRGYREGQQDRLVQEAMRK